MQRQAYLALVAIALILSAVLRVRAEVRVEAPGIAPFVLQESITENTTAWYDVETWLRRFPGTVTWDAEDGRVTYRDGSHWSALRSEPPYAVRDGRVLKVGEEPRLVGGRLLVNEAFLRGFATEFLGTRVRVEPLRGRVAPRVVIDPGHGGEDVGSRGLAGSLEKDLMLQLALAVVERLGQRGFDAHLTRRQDHAIAAAQRAAVSNYWEADLFLSLHASGAERPRARGFEVMYPSPPRTDSDPQLWSAGQLGRAEASRNWARLLGAALGDTLATFDRGVVEIPNPVLEGVTCAASLVEVGNLSAPQDAELLATDAGRTAIAAAVTQAAEAYFNEYPKTDGDEPRTP